MSRHHGSRRCISFFPIRADLQYAVLTSQPSSAATRITRAALGRETAARRACEIPLDSCNKNLRAFGIHQNCAAQPVRPLRPAFDACALLAPQAVPLPVIFPVMPPVMALYFCSAGCRFPFDFRSLGFPVLYFTGKRASDGRSAHLFIASRRGFSVLLCAPRAAPDLAALALVEPVATANVSARAASIGLQSGWT
jgi:hypothetical protein